MEFKICERCGAFFSSTNQVCDNCIPRDNVEISHLRNFLENTEETPTFDLISKETNISKNNLMRFLTNDINDIVQD